MTKTSKAKPKSPHSLENVTKSHGQATAITGPTLLTIARMFLSIVFFIFVLIPTFVSIPTLPAYILALIAFVAGAISDHIDGKWARKYQKVTDLGAFLDPLADKMLTSLAFLAFVAMGIVPIWFFAIILIRDYAVDGMRMMAAREGITIAASKFGKWKTAMQLTAIIMFLANLILEWQLLTIIANIVLYISLALTIISGLDYLIRNWKRVIKL